MHTNIDSLFAHLWQDYVSITPSAHKIHALLAGEKEAREIVNDHVAFRTFALDKTRLNTLAAHFLALGYEEKGDYNFEAKKLSAKHFEHPDDTQPKVFISELRVNELSEKAQTIIERLVDAMDADAVHADNFLYSGRHWAISKEDYDILLDESEYAAANAAKGMVNAQSQLVGLGANVLLELTQPDEEKGFATPGIIDVTDILTSLPDEEHFGPLLKVIRYTDFDDAIREANNTSFGLSAGLLADSEEDYHYFFARIRAGIVNWNRPITGASSAAPFGGVGDSGNHRASAFYAADYCAYPVASVELDKVTLPGKLSPGLSL